MKLFVCLLPTEGHVILDNVCRKYEAVPRQRGISFHWQSFGPVWVLLGEGDGGEPKPVAVGSDDGVGAGIVRLDNRADLERWTECPECTASDLELVSRTVLEHGTRYVAEILGDFAFVTWNSRTRKAIAACDAIGVKKLYWAEQNGIIAFASRAEALALEAGYDVRYLAERLAWCNPSPGLTPYRGVSAIPAGAMMVLENGRRSLCQYWSPFEVGSRPEWSVSESEAAETCLTMLSESVRLRLSGSLRTWAQLSGGMDSSSVVSLSQWLVERGIVARGLAGTLTFVDPHGSGGDERRYSEPVARRWNLRNQVIATNPTWSSTSSIPITDEPTTPLDSVERDNQVVELLNREKATALLTGGGGDVLFDGTMFFFADWVARGHVWRAVREMTRRAVIGRVSFWELAYRNALLPLLPRNLRRHLLDEWGQVPEWVDRRVASQYDLYNRASAPELYGGRLRHKYRDSVAMNIASISPNLTVSHIDEHVDTRHPYYYRPLVEFAMRLPPEACVRPHARKWVLREAMSGILPEVVRARIGKGTYDGAGAWALSTQSALVESLMQESILADCGLIDVRKLRAALDAARHERDNRRSIAGAVWYTLSIEAWLQARSGRWPRAE